MQKKKKKKLYHSLGYFSKRQTDAIFSYFSPENRVWILMQIVSNGDNLHESPNPIFWGEKIKRKIFQYVVFWKFDPERLALNYNSA